MSKIPCDVIKDLLLLYEDDVCSEQSKDIVEEHLSECAECRQYYERMTEKLPEFSEKETSKMLAENEFLTHIKRELACQKFSIAGIMLLVILVLSIVLPDIINNLDLQAKIPFLDQRLKASQIQVTELYQLKDGSIYFTLKSDKKATRASNSEIEESGSRTVALNYSFGEALSGTTFSKCSYVLPLTEIEDTDPEIASAVSTEETCNIIYYEGKGNERFVIWKEGQETEPAPESVELKVKQETTGTPLAESGEGDMILYPDLE